jgi:hypothetical protein
MRATFTLVWDALYALVSLVSASSLAAVMACQNVMGTGAVTLSSASTGHGGSCSAGIVVVVGIVAGAPPESGGAAVGTVAPPISRIDFPLPHAAATTHRPATRTTAGRRLRALIP